MAKDPSNERDRLTLAAYESIQRVGLRATVARMGKVCTNRMRVRYAHL